jgi:hydrogenase nickel incorporation protein HypA/HybF
MHEMSVTESLLEITLRHAHEANAKCVTDLYLVIGQLSSIIDDSVSFYWDIVAQNTIAEGAKLHFRRIPTQMLCLDCQRSFFPLDGDFACPDCQSTRVKVVAGEEFFLESINIET